MWSLVVLASFLVLSQGATLPHRIVGGSPADISEAPYQVALLLDTTGSGFFSLACGGSVLTEKIVITAAHCITGTVANKWMVRAGTTFSQSGGVVAAVTRFMKHQRFDSSFDYDVCLFLLDIALPLSNQIVKVILPEQDEEVEDGDVLVTGWGSTQEGGVAVTILQQVTIPLVDQEVCEAAYEGINPVTPRMVCAGVLEEGGKDACQGDSGGPMARDGVLIGITSWGRGCARPGYPGVFTRVAALREWIDENSAFLEGVSP